MHNNNFNLIRMIAALMVLYSHSYALIGIREPTLFDIVIGTLAIHSFFFISGYLITQSLLRNNIFDYFIRRFLRIYPGLIAMLLIIICFFSLFITNLSISEFFLHKQTINFFLKNSFLFNGIEIYLPGVFESNITPGVVNGSLWTLPYEVRLYLLFGCVWFICVKFQRKHKKALFILFILTLLTWYLIKLYFIDCEFDLTKNHSYYFKIFFLIGSLFYFIREEAGLLNLRFILISFIPFYYFFYLYQLNFNYLYIFFLPTFILFIAYFKNSIIARYNLLGDYSYGVYIYSFPIQQITIFYNSNLSGFDIFFISLIFVLLISYLSWVLIETKFIKLKYKTKLYFNKKINS